VLKDGRIAADATPSQLLRGEGGEEAQALVAVPKGQAERMAAMVRE
jgi:osmoprotectant transport system ATP-binding protein